MQTDRHSHIQDKDNTNLFRSEKNMAAVVILAAATMVLEILIGLYANSMALFAEGIHQGTHVLVLGINWAAYILAHRLANRRNTRYDDRKVLSLSAYTSGILLLVLAVFIFAEAVERLTEPDVEIKYVEGLVVAVIGLVVSIVSATILHSKHGRDDYNRWAAYLHVMADALTSAGTIIGLLCAMVWHINLIDAFMAILSSIVITVWALRVILDTGRELSAK